MSEPRRSCQPTSRGLVRRIVVLVTCTTVALVANGCSDGSSNEPGDGPSVTGGLHGAQTQPEPTTGGSSSGTTDAPPVLRLGFDCAAVQGAEQDLDATIAATLERFEVSANSPEGFDLTVLATAVHAADFWEQAGAVLPRDLDDAGTVVRRHWARLGPLVDEAVEPLGIVPPSTSTTTASPSDAALATAAQRHAVRVAVETLTRSHGGSDVAAVEHELRTRMARACASG